MILCVNAVCLILCTFVSNSWQGHDFIVAYISALAGIYILIIISKKIDFCVIVLLREMFLYIWRAYIANFGVSPFLQLLCQIIVYMRLSVGL